MDYNHITRFLDKFKKLLFQGQESNRIIIETITKHISYPIKEDMVKVKGTVIYLVGSPLLKSEVLVHKSGILTDISNMIPGRKFTDIR